MAGTQRRRIALRACLSGRRPPCWQELRHRAVDQGASPSSARRMPAIAVRRGIRLDRIGRRLWCVPAARFMAPRGLLGFSDPLAQLQKLEVFSFKPADHIRACRARPGPIIHAALKRISDHENERLLSGNGRRPEHARPRGSATMASREKIGAINLTGFGEVATNLVRQA